MLGRQQAFIAQDLRNFSHVVDEVRHGLLACLFIGRAQN